MKFRNRIGIRWPRAFPIATKTAFVGIVFVLSAHMLVSKPAPHVPKGIVSDWTQRHVLYPDSRDDSAIAEFQRDPRWEQNWYLRHREAWWPEDRREPRLPDDDSQRDGWAEDRRDPRSPAEKRDWSISLGTGTFQSVFDFSFSLPPQTGNGTLYTTDQGNGSFLATSGSLIVTGGSNLGTYALIPGGPGVTTSPLGGFVYDNLFTPSANPQLDVDGLLFGKTGLEINFWGNSPNNYSYYDYNGTTYGTQLTGTATFSLRTNPAGGQSFPAKFVFDVTAAPSCANDFVAIGIPVNPAAGGQANIVGVNNLYSAQGVPASPPNCTTNGPTVKFAYASGTGQVPASLAISMKGTQTAYIENLTTGKSYFHVLTIGTTGTNGTSPTSAVVPGAAGGNNAVDQTVLLSPDGGITNQSSTSAPFILYTANDTNDIAYVTTYSWAGAGSGYLYKISNVFNGSAAPTIVWSVAINAVPSTPVYNLASNRVFFTDSKGRIDYVVDSGTPTVVYGPIVAGGTTSLNPVVVDNGSQMLYASFNTNGTNASVVQAPTSLASFVSVAVGTGSTRYTGPYGPDFNNAWYTGVGTPLLYVVGTGSGTTPTLYSVGFNGGGLMNGTANATTAALTTGPADASPITEYYNPTLAKDFLFVGVTNHCIATTNGGTAGCVMSLDITTGFPTVNAATTSLAAAGGTTGIIVDNNSSNTQASSIYYATKTGVNLVKATQSALQ